METREIVRLVEIEKELAETKAKRAKVLALWTKAQRERQKLEHQIKALSEEENDLRQGQLMFKMAQ